MHDKIIRQIIEGGNTDDMYAIEAITIEVISRLKTLDYNMYLDVECRLHKMKYGSHIGEHAARKWACMLENKDGTKGGHWTKEVTDNVLKTKGLKYDEWDFYIVMNMQYSDYYEAGKTLENYVYLVQCFLDDADAGPYKLIKYFYSIVLNK